VGISVSSRANLRMFRKLRSKSAPARRRIERLRSTTVDHDRVNLSSPFWGCFAGCPVWLRQRLLKLAPAYWKQTFEQLETQQKLAANVFRRVMFRRRPEPPIAKQTYRAPSGIVDPELGWSKARLLH
jgi:hypothetical protein